MPREPIPEDLRRFILTSVPSVPFVEAILLFRTQRGEPLPTELVARRLYIPDKAAEALVQQLVEARIVQSSAPAAHRYAPDSPDLTGILDLLASYYRTHLVEVTDLIHSKASRKAQQFADAFKFKKES